MPTEPPSPPSETLPVSFDDVAGFTRKLIHDVRNGLNALDLQLASMLDGINGTESEGTCLRPNGRPHFEVKSGLPIDDHKVGVAEADEGVTYWIDSG